MKDDTSWIVLALRVLEEGEPYEATQVQSGSDYFFATTDHGLRWGQLELYVTANGSVSFIVGDRKEGMFRRHRTVYDSSGYGNTAIGLDIRRRLLKRLGMKDWRVGLPGSGTLASRQERIARLGKHYNPEKTRL